MFNKSLLNSSPCFDFDIFFCQIAIITIVVLVGLINLCFCNGTESYWAAMVATGLGSLLPAPKIKRKRDTEVRSL